MDDASKTCHVVTVHAFGCDLEVFFFLETTGDLKAGTLQHFFLCLGIRTDWLKLSTSITHPPGSSFLDEHAASYTGIGSRKDMNTTDGYELECRVTTRLERGDTPLRALFGYARNCSNFD